MPGLLGPRRGRQQQPQRKKGKSGNPAKRAAEERAAVERAATARTNPGGAFGLPRTHATGDGSVDLPTGFEKYLGR